MKAKRLFLFLAMPFILVASCDIGTASEYCVPGGKLTEKLEWLKANAESGGSYVLDISADETIGPNHGLEYSDRRNITITMRGSGGNRIINLSNNGYMFVVRTDVTLVLENITLRGRGFNSNPLIYVRSGGALHMNNGAVITGNTTMAKSGGGVLVEGTFTMNGGTISSNAAEIDGGGVAVSGGTFTMNGGTISGNAANIGGGGVAVLDKGLFIMSGGTISGNNANASGGGVVVQYGNFTMSGGTVSGNNANNGGGVAAVNARNASGSVLGIGSFTMSGGTISGNSANASGGGVAVINEGTFVMSNGSINGNGGVRGGGVSVASNAAFAMGAGTISGNTASISGGGVFVEGTFTKTGGTVTGYFSDRRNGNVVSGSPGIVESENGHAVYAYYFSSRVTKRKEISAGSEVNLSYAGRTGSFSGEWDY